MVWISCEVLVNDIGVSVPVSEDTLGILPDDSALSRKILHDSWWCLAGQWGLGAVPVEFGIGDPVGMGGLREPLLEL